MVALPPARSSCGVHRVAKILYGIYGGVLCINSGQNERGSFQSISPARSPRWRLKRTKGPLYTLGLVSLALEIYAYVPR